MKSILTFISIFFTLSLFSQSIPENIPSYGLVAWFPFNGNANDESANSNDGIVHGATLTNDRYGNPNSAFHFDGSNWITIPHDSSIDFSLSDSYTISVWFKTNSQLNMGDVMRKWIDSQYPYSYGITVGGAQSSNPSIYSSRYSGGVPQDSNRVHMINLPINNIEEDYIHFVAVYTPTEQKVYINGEFVTSKNTTISSGNVTNQIDLTIGRREGYSYRYFIGEIDDIGIWNRDLSPSEILGIFSDCNHFITTHPQNDTVSILDTAIFTINTNSSFTSYQWQTNSSIGFYNIYDSGQYSGCNSNQLGIIGVGLENVDQEFRCIVSDGVCSDTSNIVSINLTIGNHHIVSNTIVEVYPNPATNNINIIIGPDLIGSDCSLFSITGKKLLSLNLNDEITSISTSNFSNGLYIIVIDNKQQYKISIQ